MTYTFRLQQADGTPADPPTMRSAVWDWRVGHTIPVGRDRTLAVVGVVAGAELDDEPTLIVEDMAGGDAA
jgi:hypothetical protein